MIVELDGKQYDFDPKIDVRTAIVVKNYTGLGVIAWLRAVAEADPQACQAFVWACKKQAGETTEITSIVDFSPLDVTMAFAKAAEESGGDILQSKQLDPTNGPNGRTRSSTKTSEA